MNVVINEIRIDTNGRKYEYIEYDKTLPDGTPYSESKYLQTEEEIAEQQKQQRISELKLTITNKKLLDMDCTAEQTELKELLGL